MRGQVTDESAPRYRRDIDGLRAIAVTAVVLFHAGAQAFASGFVGVDIFFVISGYLIGGIIYRDTDAGRFSFAIFYARRARRILPALFATVLATLAVGLALLGAEELRQCAASAFAALLGVSNVRFFMTTDYFAPSADLNPLLMTWSLGVEEQFYVFFPLVMLALQRFAHRRIVPVVLVLSLASLLLCVWLTMRQQEAAFFLLPARAWELGVGATLVIWQTTHGERRLPLLLQQLGAVVGLALLIGSVTLLNPNAAFPGWRAILPVVGTLLLIACEGSFINRRLLGSAPLVGIGLVSYSWYLWHWPLMSYLRIVSVTPPPQVLLYAAVVVSLALGVASWRWIERPWRNNMLPAPKVLVRYAVALVAMVALPGAMYVTDGASRRLSASALRVDIDARVQTNDKCLARYGSAAPSLSEFCTAAAHSKRIALMGDSHAGALASELRRLAGEHGYGMAEFTKTSCPPLLNVTRAMPGHVGHAQQCAAFNRAALKAVLADHAIEAVVLTGYWSAPAETRSDAYVAAQGSHGLGGVAGLQAGLTALAQQLRAAGKRVLILDDVPFYALNPRARAMAELLPARRTAHRLVHGDDGLTSGVAPPSTRTASRAPYAQAVIAAAQASGSNFGRISDTLCNSQGCRFMGENDGVYMVDSQHLSPVGSRVVLASFADRIFATAPR